jgi:hypothetical protein
MYVVINLHTRKVLSFMHLTMLLASLLHLFLVEGRGRETNKQTKRRTKWGRGLWGVAKWRK